MFIGICNLELYLPGLTSLKAKRRIIKSLIDRVRGSFNVSISEIAYMDKWQRTQLGIVAVSNDSKFVESILQKIVNKIREDRKVDLLDWGINIKNGIQTEANEFPSNENYL